MRQLRASRFDSWGGEQEELEAELRVGFDLRGSARDNGGELGKHGGDCGSSEGRASEDREQVSGERGEEQVGILGVVFDLAGGATASSGMGKGSRWASGGMAPVRMVATVRRPEFSGKVRKIPTGPE